MAINIKINLTILLMCWYFSPKAQVNSAPSLSCNQATVIPTYTFIGNTTYTIAASTIPDEIVLLSCPRTILYDTLQGNGRNAIINSNSHYISNFNYSIAYLVCYVKNTGTLTILPNPLMGVLHIYYEPNAVIVNQSTSSLISMVSCSSISIPSYNCNDAGINVNELNSFQNISIYPNPANNFVTLVSKNPTEYLTIKVTDVNGRILVNKKVQTSNYKANLDLDLYNGIYFVTIIDSANDKQTKKLVIAK